MCTHSSELYCHLAICGDIQRNEISCLTGQQCYICKHIQYEQTFSSNIKKKKKHVFSPWQRNKLTFNHCLSIYPSKVPIIIPILVLLAAVFLVLAPIVDDPQIEYLYVTLFMLSGIVIYIPFIHLKLFPGLLNKLTVFLQLFLEVAPTAKNL